MGESLRRLALLLQGVEVGPLTSLPASAGITCVSAAMREVDSHFGARNPYGALATRRASPPSNAMT
jgi:hypothetical protein